MRSWIQIVVTDAVIVLACGTLKAKKMDTIASDDGEKY